MYRFIARWWPTMLVVCVIIYATWIPKPLDTEMLPSLPGLDKVIHAVMMGGLTGAVLFDMRRAVRSLRLTWRRVLSVAVAVALFSIVDEAVQGLLPIGRPSDILDLLADWVGVAVGALTAPPAVNLVLPRRK